MNLTVSEENGTQVVEGAPNESLLTSVQDITSVIETCFSEGVCAVLLYASNLTPGFFDLKSGELGEILQKLRTYQIRFAVVCPPGSVVLSERFRELLLDERRGSDFAVFETREAAWEWLSKHHTP